MKYQYRVGDKVEFYHGKDVYYRGLVVGLHPEYVVIDWKAEKKAVEFGWTGDHKQNVFHVTIKNYEDEHGMKPIRSKRIIICL